MYTPEDSPFEKFRTEKLKGVAMSPDVLELVAKAYECGFIDGMQKQMQSSVDRAVNRMAEQAEKQEPVTVLPDGSAFAVMSYPLPKDHWLYAEREYRDGEDEPVELGKPILTHQLRDSVVSAVRYAVRGATNCGKEVDFDPDALVQNAVYALCGPYGGVYTSPPPRQPLTDEEIAHATAPVFMGGNPSLTAIARAIEAAHGIKEKNDGNK